MGSEVSGGGLDRMTDRDLAVMILTASGCIRRTTAGEAAFRFVGTPDDYRFAFSVIAGYRDRPDLFSAARSILDAARVDPGTVRPEDAPA